MQRCVVSSSSTAARFSSSAASTSATSTSSRASRSLSLRVRAQSAKGKTENRDKNSFSFFLLPPAPTSLLALAVFRLFSHLVLSWLCPFSPFRAPCVRLLEVESEGLEHVRRRRERGALGAGWNRRFALLTLISVFSFARSFSTLSWSSLGTRTQLLRIFHQQQNSRARRQDARDHAQVLRAVCETVRDERRVCFGSKRRRGSRFLFLLAATRRRPNDEK